MTAACSDSGVCKPESLIIVARRLLQDLLSGAWLPKENGEFQVQLQPGETRLLEIVGY